ncbi:MAG: hypothetical protein OXT09_07210 [Myxococcales bacterium]|nr:hypothetical protein [Myxococcales bacterium]
MPTLPEWLDPALAAALAVGSLLSLIGGVALVPLVITRLPADYFVRGRAERKAARRHPLLRIGRLALQNAVGGTLLLAGIAMLVLPGQGVLTILAALTLLTFPGKRRLQRRILALPGLHRLVDALRRRAGKPPLELGRPHE